MPTGLGMFQEVQAKLTPEIFTPESGNALYVFALPDQGQCPVLERHLAPTAMVWTAKRALRDNLPAVASRRPHCLSKGAS